MFPAIIIAVAAGMGLIFGLLGGTIAGIPKVQLPPKAKPVVLDLTQNPTVPPKSMDDFTQVAKELDEWRKELTEKRNQALQFDAELLRREQLIKAEREALSKERQRLIALQQEVEDSLIKIKASEDPKLQELADLYSTLKPEAAVEMLRVMNDQQVIKIMTKMRPKIQAKILAAWLKGANEAEKTRIAGITTDMKKVMPDDGKPTGSSEINAPAQPESASLQILPAAN